MSGVLFIGEVERKKIATAVERARADAIPWEELHVIARGDETTELRLEDRPQGTAKVRKKYPPQHLLLGTYHAAISFEHQPAGLMRHLSVSSRKRGKVPGPEVMAMVAEAFGFSGWPPLGPSRVWLEEFEPGHNAVNVVELVAS